MTGWKKIFYSLAVAVLFIGQAHFSYSGQHNYTLPKFYLDDYFEYPTEFQKNLNTAWNICQNIKFSNELPDLLKLPREGFDCSRLIDWVHEKAMYIVSVYAYNSRVYDKETQRLFPLGYQPGFNEYGINVGVLLQDTVTLNKMDLVFTMIFQRDVFKMNASEYHPIVALEKRTFSPLGSSEVEAIVFLSTLAHEAFHGTGYVHGPCTPNERARECDLDSKGPFTVEVLIFEAFVKSCESDPSLLYCEKRNLDVIKHHIEVSKRSIISSSERVSQHIGNILHALSWTFGPKRN